MDRKIEKQAIIDLLDENLLIINTLSGAVANGIRYNAYIKMIRLMGYDIIEKDGKHKLIG